jgi:hypothetical protein
MSGVALGITAGGLVGGYLTSQAAGKAAGQQADAANAANQMSWAQYQQNRTDQAPWRDAGVAALGNLNTNMGDYTRDFGMKDFQADPGYAFRMSEGQKAIERSAAARGGLNSGATMKALDRFSQGTASDEYNNAYNRFNSDRDRRFNRLASIAGLGQTATSQVGANGMATAGQMGQNMMGAANAQSAATMAGGKCIYGRFTKRREHLDAIFDDEPIVPEKLIGEFYGVRSKYHYVGPPD